MTKLSSEPQELRDRYGAIVIGSGYGGSICGARLAEAGKSVCLLERGREWAPGEFPDDQEEVLGEFRSSDNPMGLFDYRYGDDVDVLVGNGLGGTSLINANVVIAPDHEIFSSPRWPRGIRAAAADGTLAFYGQRVIEMLQATDERPPAGWPAKVEAMQQSAARAGGAWKPVKLAVNMHRFDNAANHVGVVQHVCTQCGDCVTGCNVGAKNALYTNYLPLAKKHGIEIFTGIEVRYVLPSSGGGYFVFASDVRDPARPPRVIHGNVVILAAGSLGSTGILLRSAERGLAVSRRLGHHFSGNGDQLGFGYNNDVRTDVLGCGDHRDARARLCVGPTIASMVHFRDGASGPGIIIEEGAIPRAFVDALRRLGPKLSLLQGVDTDRGVGDKARELARALRDQVRYDPAGAANHSMLYLGIGRDDSDGRIVLDPHGEPAVLWSTAVEQPLFKQISDKMQDLVKALGGTFIPNPRWSELFGRNLITVHPLGGCPMGDDAESGVVDELGRVFDPASGDATRVHPGLYVADGAILPEAVGVNPLYTISVLAERIAERIAARTDVVPQKGRLEVPLVPTPPVGLQFSEEMAGFVTTEITDAQTPEGFRAAEARGREQDSHLSFKLTMFIADLGEFIRTRDHRARVEGACDSRLCGPNRRIEFGHFNLYVVDLAKNMKNMFYVLHFIGEDGTEYRLDGFKEVRDDPGFDLWADNTTLFTTIRAGWGQDAPAVAQGVLYIGLPGFLRLLKSMRARNSPSKSATVRALGRFGKFFFGELWESYVSHAASDSAVA